MKLHPKLYHFFKKHLQKGHHLIGVSAGVDSMYLLYQLALYKNPQCSFTVVSIDHGVRAESAQEVLFVQKESQKLGFACLTPSLKLKTFTEEKARKRRYELLAQIYHEQKAQGLLLGHHQYDQHETIMKRFFEGAPLISMSGIQPQVSFDGMTILRPLLNLSKNEIYKEMRDHPFYEDPTNTDGSNLRSSMRESLIPSIESAFGKNIRSNLNRWEERINRINTYLTSQVKKELDAIDWQADKISIDATVHELELEHLLRLIFKKLGWKCSTSQIETLLRMKTQATGGKKVIFKEGQIIFQKKCFSIVKNRVFERTNYL